MIMFNFANDIFTELKVELENQPTYNEDLVKVKINNAIREVRALRNYKATNYTESEIEVDLEENYYQTIKNLALYDFSQVGAPFETTHAENSINRTWCNREKITANVISFVDMM